MKKTNIIRHTLSNGFIVISLIGAIVLGSSFRDEQQILAKTSKSAASSKSKHTAAGKAFAAALSDGTIKCDTPVNFNIADIDGDGIKDLFLCNNSLESADAYAYKSGKITKILTFTPDMVLQYDSKKKIFWMTGEGGCGWVYAYKYKNGKLLEKYSYFSDQTRDGKIVYKYQKKGKKAKKISHKKYTAAWRYAQKWYKETTKENLIKKLKSLK